MSGDARLATEADLRALPQAAPAEDLVVVFIQLQ
jgi:hypothetical protein